MGYSYDPINREVTSLGRGQTVMGVYKFLTDYSDDTDYIPPFSYRACKRALKAINQAKLKRDIGQIDFDLETYQGTKLHLKAKRVAGLIARINRLEGRDIKYLKYDELAMYQQETGIDRIKMHYQQLGRVEQVRRIFMRTDDKKERSRLLSAIWQVEPSSLTKVEYRRLARQHHPDYATGEVDRLAREDKMKEINRRYQR